jgi:hypothetical protein
MNRKEERMTKEVLVQHPLITLITGPEGEGGHGSKSSISIISYLGSRQPCNVANNDV